MHELLSIAVDVNRHGRREARLGGGTKQTRQKKISKIKNFGGGTREEK